MLDRLCLALAPLVKDMWLDRLGGDQGMGEWTRDSMRRGVANADVIISVVSPKYMKSKNCGFEMALAAEMGKTIIPIMLGVPFEEWPPARIGETDMTGQYADAASGDMKLFVDFSKLADFDVKFWNELKPRLADASFVPTTSAAIREPPSAFFDLLNRCVTIRLRTLKRVPRFPIAHGIVLPPGFAATPVRTTAINTPAWYLCGLAPSPALSCSSWPPGIMQSTPQGYSRQGSSDCWQQRCRQPGSRRLRMRWSSSMACRSSNFERARPAPPPGRVSQLFGAQAPS